ncbi:MAG TPA: alpha/beta fold hydrolase [Solirubrobacteraceae bacterium]|nr:alpha/beta fold hydrolase [Solirubrobacteraceae bacterium]
MSIAVNSRRVRNIAAAFVSTLLIGAVPALAIPATASATTLHVPYGNEALSDFVTAELFTPTQLAGANDGCKPSAAHPYPVVLVHGTAEDEGSNWVTLSPLLANAGYCVYAFNYGETSLSLGGRVDGLGYIEKSAEELSSFVNSVLSRTGASKVDIVGHSQGGMMPNYYIKFLGGASKVNVLIGLAPSNHGTTLDGLTTLLEKLPFASVLAGLLEDIGAPSLVQQEQGSAFETHLFAGGDTVPGPRYVVIESTHDEIVTPYTNAFLSGPDVTDITLQSQCPNDPTGHIGMIEDSPALQNVLNQLSSSPNPSFTATCTNYGASL